MKVSALMLAAVLVQFYRGAGAMFISPATYAGELSPQVRLTTSKAFGEATEACDSDQSPYSGGSSHSSSRYWGGATDVDETLLPRSRVGEYP